MPLVRIRLVVAAALVAVLGLAALPFLASSPVVPRPRLPWTIGYWVWAGEPPRHSSVVPDLLYVEAPSARWPRDLPRAHAFIVVQRLEPLTPLTPAVAASVAQRFQRSRALAADAGPDVRVAGLQIDYDCPTRALKTYGAFLQEVRHDLPPGTILSITALLDWFTPRSDVGEVLRSVDEYVPQFYDVAPERLSSGIAAPIDAATWGPRFDAFGVPYRIGIASFGRIARRRTDSTGRTTVHYFRDASPAWFADRPQLRRSTTSTAAGELVVRYDVGAPLAGRADIGAGDRIDVTFPTEDSVRAAVAAARQFGGYCAGIVFFRWPTRSETLALEPDFVDRIVAGTSLATHVDATLSVTRAQCLDRDCEDLYLNLDRVATEDRTLVVRASGSVELFLPGDSMRAAARDRDIAVHIPAFSGIGRMYVGRAISRTRLDFEVLQP